jgi:hypothetical protein
MADLFFNQGVGNTYTPIAFTKDASNVISAGSTIGLVAQNDAVKVVYTDTYERAIYGVCTNESIGEITFDDNIYTASLNSFTATVSLYNNAVVDEVSVYRVGVDVENGLYSKAYNQYTSNISYTLRIPARRNDYFGVASTIVTSSDVVFVDLCDSKAYGVGISEASFDTLNNKFKSSLEFNIATR